MISKELEGTLNTALKEAKRRRHEYVCLEHLLYALLQDKDASGALVNCGGDIEGLVAVLDPDVVVRLDQTTASGVPRVIRGAQNWAKGAAAFSRSVGVHDIEPALVDGSLGLVWAPRGKLQRVLRFTFAQDKIVEINIIGDAARLRDLDLAVLPR